MFSEVQQCSVRGPQTIETSLRGPLVPVYHGAPWAFYRSHDKAIFMDSFQQRLDDISRQLESLRAVEQASLQAVSNQTGDQIKQLETEREMVTLQAKAEKALPNRDADSIPYLPCQIGFIQDNEILTHLMKPRSKGGHGLNQAGAQAYYAGVRSDPWAMVALARSVRGIGH